MTIIKNIVHAFKTKLTVLRSCKKNLKFEINSATIDHHNVHTELEKPIMENSDITVFMEKSNILISFPP